MTLDAPSLRRVVWVLCTTEITSWGVLFYAFPVLAGAMAEREGWPLTTLVGVFTGAQVVAAAAGVWVGRHIDRHGPRLVMTAGSVLAVVSTVAVALAPTLTWFAAAWLLVGLAMSATLYPPAFAAVTHWAGDEHRVRALTALTLVAGFASTVFAPLTAVLADAGTWRTAYLLLAVPLAVTVPLHLWGLWAPWPSVASKRERSAESVPRSSRLAADPVIRQPRFVLLVLALTLAGFSVYAVVVNFVPLLTENGITTTMAAVALGIGGAGQVAGRLLYGPVLARIGIVPRTAVVLAAAGLTTAALALTPGPIALVCALSFVAGTARGIFTLIQATAVTDRWGTAAYGARSGLLSGAVTTAAALSPWAGAALATVLNGYSSAFLVLAAFALGATILVLAETRVARSREALLPFDAVIEALGSDGAMGSYGDEVELDVVVGSVARSEEFDAEFRPLADSSRLRRARRLFRDGSPPPAVELIRLGDLYFVIDGHHRIAVARELGWTTMPAQVRRICTVAYARCCLRLIDLEVTAAERDFATDHPIPSHLHEGLRLDQPADWHRLRRDANDWAKKHGDDRCCSHDLTAAWWAQEVEPAVARSRRSAQTVGLSDIQVYVQALADRDRLEAELMEAPRADPTCCS